MKIIEQDEEYEDDVKSGQITFNKVSMSYS